MRLLDQLAQACTGQEVVGGGRVIPVPSAADRATDVCSVPLRYILQPSISWRCRDLLSTDRGMFAPDNMLLRAPAPRLWVEWEEEIRIGLLVQADESGRRGQVELFWEQAEDEPLLAQAMLAFDLDQTLPVPTAGSSVFALQADDHPLADHLRFHFAEAWLEHLFEGDVAAGREGVATICASVLHDAEMLFAFAALLLHRSEVAMAAQSLERLNRQRAARKKPPLLDHIEVTLGLDRAAAAGRPSGESRSPRLHAVRGHMVHRRDQSFWRRSHFRGDPSQAIVSRTVRVR